MSIQTINPFTGKKIKEFEQHNITDINISISKAEECFKQWRNTSFARRKELMLNVAKILKERNKKYGEILTLEMGKPISQAVAEIEKCALVAEYYAENAETILKEERIITDASESYVRFDPLGVILAVMPWNFPFWQVFRFASPALMAGNTCLLKHASNVPMSALAIEEIFNDAGFPEGAFKTLLIGSDLVEKIIDNPIVKAVTLTGSEDAGKKVASCAGKNLKKVVLELGGSDPFIVLNDADIEVAAEAAVKGRLINNGESCIASKRFIVEAKIYELFRDAFRLKFKNVKIGDPMDYQTELGPIARKDLLIELDAQVKRSIEMGASVVTGGEVLDLEGYFYSPTILDNLKPGMPAYDDEIFGPVASLINAEDENDVLRIANSSEFGLGASIWTNNITRAKEIAAEIESGSVFINGNVKSDPRLPFGGVKKSGFGRELSHYGIKEFVNIKSVWIK
ncbi:succinate-semialdehyde dehydrogenase [bacterium BRH_c32]|nr:MAG: succinate-semialdehyde dehydrogenase [bacterium BRH_c32]